MPPPTTILPPPTNIVTDILSHLSNAAAHFPSTPSKHPGDDSPSTKPYLLTLHAFFPTILLPALDLLDRRLVTQLELSDPALPSTTVTTDNEANVQQPTCTGGYGRTGPAHREPPGDAILQVPQSAAASIATPQAIEQPTLTASLMKNSTQPNLNHVRIYYVRSSQPPTSSSSSSTRLSFSSRSNKYSSSRAPQGGKMQPGFQTNSYEVRTRAWSCSCAAFAFAALNTHHGGHRYDHTTSEEAEEDGGGEVEYEDDNVEDEDEGGGTGNQKERDTSVNAGVRGEWGGLMALYGRASSRRVRRRNEQAEDNQYCAPLPLCKHLLACVLAEWWDEAAELVERRIVGREEIAGWAAGWGG